MGRPTKEEVAARKAKEQAEFDAKVEERVLSLVPTLVAQMQAARGDTPAASIEQPSVANSSDMAFAEKLAMAISQLTDQGTGRRRVAPEIIEQRAKAREKMGHLIIKARAEGLMPSYKLRNKVYLDEVLVDPVYMDAATKTPKPTEIDWPGVPNEAMVPVNDSAKEIYAAFMEAIGSVVKVVSEDTFGVTVNGLVVKNGAVQPRRALPSGDHQATSQGLNIKHKQNVPVEQREVRVLGTVAPPARMGM